MRHAAALLAILSFAATARSQDIYLFELRRTDTGYRVENGRNVTRRAGYDNQPFFSADSRSFVYTSVRAELGDVYEYDLETGETRHVIDTPEVPEYSPMPGSDGATLTVVRENTVPDQTVWRVDRASGTSEWALSSREPIGYYRFNERGEALLWVRYAFTVQLYRPGRAGTTFVSGHAAPSTPMLVPGGHSFSFVHHQVNGEAWIKRVDPDDLSVTPVAPILEGQIHYAWTRASELLAGRGSTLYHWAPGRSTEWTEVIDLASLGVDDITRLIVSPDDTKIAIVAADSDR